jgi:hypothetical protein
MHSLGRWVLARFKNQSEKLGTNLTCGIVKIDHQTIDIVTDWIAPHRHGGPKKRSKIYSK